MSKAKRLPPRSKVKADDRWDLATLYTDDAAWDEAFGKWEKKIGRFAKFRGTLGKSAEDLAKCLKFSVRFDEDEEQLGTYAFLRSAEDTGDSAAQAMMARYMNAASRAAEAGSFIQPELLAIPTNKMKRFLADRRLAPFRLLVERSLRYKPHTLSDSEEKLLAMQGEMSATASQVFRQLNNADLRFGMIEMPDGRQIELSHGSFSTCLHAPERDLRKRAFHQYYEQFDAHKNTLAATLAGSIQRDDYYAKVRNYPSALESALFPDNVPVSVYDNLVDSVSRHLPVVHRYYELRRRQMKLRALHHYDTYAPIVSEVKTRHTWNQAVSTVVAALEPLGDEYCATLDEGLRGRWCDRYENQGKQSGAFSSGSYRSDPFILMNYQPEVLDHVFTLAHEAGHSMHSWYSARSQPFPYYQYKIFVAEVASTFNEQLLSRHLLQRARDDRYRALLINREIDSIRATVVRQTMFAEFEKITHGMAEANEPLTLDAFRAVYRQLLEKYFGPKFVLDEVLSLECLRIPHFYRAFYVYKYATGMSAAIALAQRVSQGGRRELDGYLGCLCGAGSKFPLALLRGAGVDMEQPEPGEAALAYFARLVDELDELL